MGRRWAVKLAASLLATWSIAGGTAAVVERTEWSLEAAVLRALEVHPNGERARARLAEAEARWRQAGAGNLPSLEARLHYYQTTNPMQGFGAILSHGTFDNAVNFNDPGQLDGLTGQLEGRYRIYSGGSVTARRAAAQAMLRAGESGVSAVERALEAAVVQAYFGVKQSDAIMASLAAGIRVVEESLRVSEAREAAGEMIRTERLNLEVRLAQLRREHLGSQHEARRARLRLGFLLDLEAGARIELVAEDRSMERIHYPERMSVDGRAELQGLRRMVEAARHEVDGARGGYKPTVDAYATLQGDKGWRREGDGSSWTAGVMVRMPLFDGHNTRAEVMAARARLRQAESDLRRLESQLKIELEEAKLGYELAVAQRAVARQQVVQAEEAAALSRERFAAGTLLSTELIGVESRLIDARVQHTLAEVSERTALASLRRASGLGILLLNEDGNK